MIPDRIRAIITPDVCELAELFAAQGSDLYLVGGSVRDAMLGRVSHDADVDLATDARPDDIERIGGRWANSSYLVGKAFGTIGLVKDNARFEVTTFRSETYRDDSRKPVVLFGDDIELDLSRRDFTVNAMAIKVPTTTGSDPEMMDPFGGLADLAAKVLRTPMSPEVSFGDDPLRMLRLFRFVSTLEFTPDDEALRAVVRLKERLEIVSAERVRAEFDKLMVGSHVAQALDGLIDSGLANEFIPEIPALAVEQDPQHKHKDVLAHTIAVVSKTSPRMRLRLAALFHDIGKPATREFGEGGVSFHHHEVVGARMTRKRMRELRYPNDMIKETSQLVFLHMRPHTYKMGWTDSAVRRYVRDAGPLLDDLNELVRCDVTTRNARRARTISNRIDELEVRIEELAEKEELHRMRPPIDGNDIMRHLGLKPSRAVGDIMNMLLERRIEDGPYTEEEAYVMLDDWQTARTTDN